MKLLHTFWLTQDSLGKLSHAFIFRHKNELNEEGDSYNGMVEVQVYDIGTL